MYLIDSNIFLEVLLLQERYEDCENFLRLLAKGKKLGVVTDFSIHSIMIIMSNLDKLKELKIFLSSLTAYKGLKIYRTTLTDEIKAVEISAKQELDMDDAIQYATALALNVEAIVSLDKHFDNLNVPRKEPSKKP
jgi:predicted nucleic acid-binding protein